MFDPFDDYMDDIITRDDKEQLLLLLAEVGDRGGQKEFLYTFIRCGQNHAKRCLLAMIEGEECPPADQIYAALAPDHNPLFPTPLACVASLFPEAYDLLQLLLKRGPLHHANIKCHVKYYAPVTHTACPLDHALLCLSKRQHICQSSPDASLIKLMILLCQWESKPILNCARLLAPHTDGINEFPLSYVKEGKCRWQLCFLWPKKRSCFHLARSHAHIGLTIQEHVTDLLQKLSSEGDLDYEGAMYRSMLIEAGYALEPIDHDLRDCYRNNPELRKATMYKLSDPGIPNNKYRLPSSLTRPHDFGTFVSSYPYPGFCQLFHKLKTDPVVNLNPCVLQPRLLRTVAGHAENGCSGITGKHLTSIAFRLKRGLSFEV